MSRTNHPVYQVLVAKTDVAPLLVANKTVGDLLPGQIGIFNYESSLSVDGTDTNALNRVFFAVGMDKNADGVTDDIMKSSGECIDANRIHHATLQYPEDCIPQTFVIKPIGIKGQTEYVLKIQFQNEELATLYGKNLPTKSFYAKTGCCETEAVCECTDNKVCADLVVQLVSAINIDPDGIVTASLWDVVAEEAIANLETWLADADNADACPGIQLIGDCGKMETFCDINYGYHKLRAFHMTVSFYSPQAINLSMGTITEVQELQYPQGSWYDIMQMEYEAGGWNGRPGVYRSLELADRPMPGIAYNTVKNTKYITISLGYDSMSVVGFQEPINDLETVLCIPCSATIGTLYGTWTAFTALLAKAGIVLPVFLNSACGGTDTTPELNN